MNLFRTGWAVFALAGAGCASWLPAPVPMRSVSYLRTPEPGRCLLVMLPGAGDAAETFVEHGFVDAVRARGLSVDLVAANATMGYYFKGTFFDRLHEDVLGPARARGYQKVWLLGISMGGLGALMTADRAAGLADGLVLFAPYLGDEELVREVERAGGLEAWAPGPLEARYDERNYQRHVWSYLKKATAAKAPPIYLGFGEADRMGEAARVLGRALPAGHVSMAPGGHDWPPWKKLWSELQERSAFASDCAAAQ